MSSIVTPFQIFVSVFHSVFDFFCLYSYNHSCAGERLEDWIAILLQSASTRVLVNGCLTEEIQHCRGLRQGDPLSPLLFVLVMDVLAKLVEYADRHGLLTQLGRQPLTHRISLYADDIALFICPTAADVDATKKILLAFGQAAGLHANLNKSSITPIQCHDIDSIALAGLLGCKHAHFPCTYVGMPLSDKRLCKGDYQPALDKLASKAKGWKRGHFSLDARMILVKHVLSAMVVFQMIAIEAPIWLTKAADKIRRGFLWAKEDVAAGGKCLANRKTVCRPLELGGLGVPDLQARGLALRMRWL